ncbi:MAG TPA: GAF domain-containing SpoIIE family protein phosphatase [Bryobacteraceae bacterium]|nr:GAF domain-containing SpoIIE family protein phosphatase [Bryobacteraceae bacterium]
MRFGSLRPIWILIALYFAASLTYFIANNAAFYDRILHANRHIRDPFVVDSNLAITHMTDEARAAGLSHGDVMESINGQPYHGEAQWTFFDRRAHPGEMMRIGIRSPHGEHRHIVLHLVQAHAPHLASDQWVIFIGLQTVCTLICLLVGLWVVIAKPRERNAWLILLLLTFPEVLFPLNKWWTGGLLFFETIWFQILLSSGPIVVLLIGIYFPERWRVDIRAPWFKWLLILPQIAGLLLSLATNYRQMYFPVASSSLQRFAALTDPVMDVLSLLCALLYLLAIFDKLRTASNADARRRMKVLCAGSSIGLGALLLFVLLRTLVHIPHSIAPWLFSITGILILVFPVSLAYVVVVQRALDVRILLRMGTKYILARASLMVLELILLTIVLWRILEPLFAQESVQVHDVLIPLAVAAVLFALAYFGLSKRMARWIDRKFFREAYTAELVLNDLSEQARTLTEGDSLIETVSRRVSEVLHVPQIAVLLRGGQMFQLQQAIGAQFPLPLALSEQSQTVQAVVRENRPTAVYREDPEGWFAQVPSEEQQALNAVNAEILLPLPGRRKLMGLMTLGPKLSDEPYSPTDLRLLQSVAAQTGLALEVSDLAHSLAREAAGRERINRELEIAREVQEHLFPQVIPRFPGVSLAGACRPAQGIGGDYYDFIEIEDGRLGLAIGDVSGKGISAALVMAGLRSALHGMMLEGSHDLPKLMSNVNRLIYEGSTDARYATFFLGILAPLSHQFQYVNAGHNPPVILRADGSLIRLEVGGPVVGLFRHLPYETESIRLAPGDLLIAYTDGISEAMTVEEEEWGETRMIAAAREVRQLSAEQIVACLFAAADSFTRGAPQHDDMTLSVLKVESPATLFGQ